MKHYSNRFEVKSAGLILDPVEPFILNRSVAFLEEKGISVDNPNSQLINDQLIKWADKIIIVADDVSNDSFPKEKIIRWDIADIHGPSVEKLNALSDQIDVKVKEFIKENE